MRHRPQVGFKCSENEEPSCHHKHTGQAAVTTGLHLTFLPVGNSPSAVAAARLEVERGFQPNAPAELQDDQLARELKQY